MTQQLTHEPSAEESPRATPPAATRVRRTSGPRLVLTVALYGALLVLLVRVAALPLSNTDTYFHLRFGAEFLHHWSLWHPGSVSTFATSSWLPTQWLPEVVMAWLEQTFGLAGVAWLFGVLLVSLFSTLYLVARRWVDPLVSLLLTVAALGAASENLSMRPQMISFLMVAITAAAWLRTREDGRLRWWLVPMTWVWAMSHGMWSLGIVIGVVAVAGLALDRSRPQAGWLQAALVPTLSAVAAGLTPIGPALYGQVLAVGSRSQYFSEWNPPDWTYPSCMVLAVLLALTITLMVRRRMATWFDLGLLLLTAAFAVSSWRTVPVAAMMIVPLAAAQARPRDADPDRRIARPERLLVAGGAVAALVALAVAVPHTSDSPPPQPSWVDPSLSSLPAGTKVVGAWDWGGYLMWRYPRLDLLMHGYGDTFTTSELQRNTDIEALSPGWDEELRATGVTVAVQRPSSALAYALEHQEHWTVVHRSPSIEMLQAPAGWTTGG